MAEGYSDPRKTADAEQHDKDRIKHGLRNGIDRLQSRLPDSLPAAAATERDAQRHSQYNCKHKAVEYYFEGGANVRP